MVNNNFKMCMKQWLSSVPYNNTQIKIFRQPLLITAPVGQWFHPHARLDCGSYVQGMCIFSQVDQFEQES